MRDKKTIALVVSLLVIVAAAAFLINQGGQVGGVKAPEALPPEAALPAFGADGQHFVAVVRDLSGPRRGVEFLKEFMMIAGSDDVDLSKGLGSYYDVASSLMDLDGVDGTIADAETRLRPLGMAGAVLSAADELAIFSDMERSCVAFTTNEEKFAAMRAEYEKLGRPMSKWDASFAGSDAEGCVISGDDGGASAYVVSRKAGSGLLVTICSDEGTARSADAAIKNPAERASVKRTFDEPNYAILRLNDVPTLNGKKYSAVNEAAWRGDGKATKLRSRCETTGTEAPITSGIAELPAFYGKGAPIALLSIDPVYLTSSLFPGDERPVASAIDMAEALSGTSIPSEYRDDIVGALSDCRISCGAFAGSKQPSGYVMIEMKDPGRISKYLALASLLMPKVDIEGWDQAFSAEVSEGLNVVIALKDGKLLIGAGDAADYAGTAPLPEELGIKSGDKSPLLLCYFAPEQLIDPRTHIGGIVSEALENTEKDDEDKMKASAALEAFRKFAFRSLAVTQKTAAESEMVVSW